MWRQGAEVKGERRNQKSERRTDARSESRSKVSFDYAEQEGGKDDVVGLKEKYPEGVIEISPGHRPGLFISTIISGAL